MKFERDKEYKTRGGQKAVIYKTDAPGTQPMFGLITIQGTGPKVCAWDLQGYRVDPKNPHPDDLVSPYGSKRPRMLAYYNHIGILGLFPEGDVPSDVGNLTRAPWLDEPKKSKIKNSSMDYLRK